MEGHHRWTARRVVLVITAVAVLWFLAGLIARSARGDTLLLLSPTDDTFAFS